MRISDWSSDVCSSDLHVYWWFRRANVDLRVGRRLGLWRLGPGVVFLQLEELQLWRLTPRSEERRVGKECSVRVALGGRRILKKKKRNIHTLCATEHNT